MTTNSMIDLRGYDVVASALCDLGAVLVLNNNSTHFLVVETESGGESVEPELGGVRHTVFYNSRGRVVASFAYGGRVSARSAFSDAARRMVERAVECTTDEDPEACPGCGCGPGDGRTKGCSDPDGCGYYEALESETK